MKFLTYYYDEVVFYLVSKDEHAIVDRQRHRPLWKVECDSERRKELPQIVVDFLEKQASSQETTNEAV